MEREVEESLAEEACGAALEGEEVLLFGVDLLRDERVTVDTIA